MERSTKDAWLNGPGDLREADVEDVPVKGQSIRVRGLPAAYSNEALSKALELKSGPRGEDVATVNAAKLEIIQFTHGCVDPKFTEAEAMAIAQKYGPAFHKVVSKIDELSGIDKETIEKTQATFPASGQGPANGRPAEPLAIAAGTD